MGSWFSSYLKGPPGAQRGPGAASAPRGGPYDYYDYAVSIYYDIIMIYAISIYYYHYMYAIIMICVTDIMLLVDIMLLL